MVFVPALWDGTDSTATKNALNHMGKIVSYLAVTNVLTRHVIDLTGVVSLNAEMEINAIKRML